MPEFNWLTAVFGGTSLASISAVVWGVVKDVRGGTLRKGRAEAERADVEVDQLEHLGPLTQEGLRIGQADQLVIAQGRALAELGTQLTAANARIAERDRQLAEADTVVGGLRAQIRERDSQIDELELRLGTAEDELRRARSIITELRESPDHTPPPPATPATERKHP